MVMNGFLYLPILVMAIFAFNRPSAAALAVRKRLGNPGGLCI